MMLFYQLFSSSNGGASVGYSLTSKIVLEALENINDNTDTEMMLEIFRRHK